MNWNELNHSNQLTEIDAASATNKVMILKHSTRCSISASALNRLERNWKANDNDKIKPYYLDLIANRQVSNDVAKHYNIEHESPQVLVISNGKCIYNVTHSEIRYEDLMEAIALSEH
jgi:bacillithiol system protein YtxJ